MFLAPPGANYQRAAFTLLELLAVITLIALLAGLVLGTGRRAAEAAKVARARAELAGLGAALEDYRRTFGDFPRTGDAALLLQSLIGKRDPHQTVVSARSMTDLARFQVAESRDPFTDGTAVLVDPWGQPYRYVYRTQIPWSNPGYVLYSIGPDGEEAGTLLSGGFPDQTVLANADNIYANR